MEEEKTVYKVPAELDPCEAAALYVEATWLEEADPQTVKKMLQGTFAVSAAYCDGRLIGFMRALSDGVSDAYLLDLIVSKKFRNRGVGGRIVENLVTYLQSCGVDWACCIGVPGTEKFYEKCGGKVMKDHIPFRFEGK